MPTLSLEGERALSVRNRLINRPRTLHLKQLANEARVSERWLQHIVAGSISKSSIILIDALDQVLKNHNL